MWQLAPEDDAAARDHLSQQLGVDRDSIKHIRVTDWLIGEVIVSFNDARPLAVGYLEPAVSAAKQ